MYPSKYFDSLSGGTDTTLQVASGGWSTPLLAAGESRDYRVEITPSTTIGECAMKDVLVRAAAFGGSEADVVKASVRATNSVPPAAPTGLYAVSTGSGKITLYWEAVPNATGYNIYRSSSAGAENYTTPIATGVGTPSYAGGSTLMWTDSGLNNGSEYFYTVKALTNCAEGEASNEDSDVVDPDGIPWDSRDPNTIVAAAIAEANAADPEGEGIEPEHNVVVSGPDGALYERGEPSQLISQGEYDPVGNTMTFEDGTTIALPTGGGEDESMAPFDLGRDRRLINLGGGSYIGNRAGNGQFRGAVFNVDLPSVNVTTQGIQTHLDTPHCYLGLVSPVVADAGVMYKNGGWEPYYQASDGIKKPTYEIKKKTRFALQDRIRMKIYMNTWSQRKSKKRLVILGLVSQTDTTLGTHLMRPIRFGNQTYLRPKRFIQLAQNQTGQRGSGAIGDDAATGSSMTDVHWMNGGLYKMGETGSTLWTSGYTASAVYWRGSHSTVSWITNGADYNEYNTVALSGP